jgi:hypothetical protein
MLRASAPVACCEVIRSYPQLALATIAYGLASLLHFAHNGLFLAEYPHLPSSITVLVICCTWLATTSIGAIGWWAVSAGRIALGLTLIGAYACFGFDGLAHYSVAPLSAHTMGMNATIGLEALAAAILLCVAATGLMRHAFVAKRMSE